MKKVKWEIEEIYPKGDFQCRIMSRGSLSDGQDEIVCGEPTKRGGRANIHCKSNALLIAAAPELLAICEEFIREVECGAACSQRTYGQMKSVVDKIVNSSLT